MPIRAAADDLSPYWPALVTRADGADVPLALVGGSAACRGSRRARLVATACSSLASAACPGGRPSIPPRLLVGHGPHAPLVGASTSAGSTAGSISRGGQLAMLESWRDLAHPRVRKRPRRPTSSRRSSTVEGARPPGPRTSNERLLPQTAPRRSGRAGVGRRGQAPARSASPSRTRGRSPTTSATPNERGKTGHGFSRVAWLETLPDLDPAASPSGWSPSRDTSAGTAAARSAT